ncbi:precorrin-6A synthase (deacetylating) [Pseudomonas cremoricolorata]|uniref:Precorrin 6A synthase n=1 Tax=Pseudomonas cremoricolorata TaxID=157783 RepID=A0A089WPH7_9PSED|nr:precorrin-6A synthase (deacetylating) [Pseudomonas cremoricolorata]AIR91165.1 precorrin 6A synthase [Pseudomonas cremoricolorata]
MKQLLLIGIGPGDPRQITLQAIEALRRAQVFFVLDKGLIGRELLRTRHAMLDQHRADGNYRLVQVADPRRDQCAAHYQRAVEDWHEQRAALYARLLRDELKEGETGAFLLWGEPGLYDSTLRILDRVRQRGLQLTLEVIPGISSVQALAAKHQIPLNRVGEPLTILPGRRMPDQSAIDNVVVMLDGDCHFAHLEDPALFIYWGAYLGSSDELLIAGPLQHVKARILQVRERARREKGWIMDTYLLRRVS